MSIFGGIGKFLGGLGNDASNAEHFVAGLFNHSQPQAKGPQKPNIIQRVGGAIGQGADAAAAQAEHDAQLAAKVVIPKVKAVASPVIHTINNIPLAGVGQAEGLLKGNYSNTGQASAPVPTPTVGSVGKGVIKNLVIKPVVNPAINIGKDIGSLAYADATNTAPTRKVSLRKFAGNDLQTGINAATLGSGGEAETGVKSLLGKIFSGAKTGATLGAGQGTSDALRSKESLKKAAINTALDTAGGGALGAGGATAAHVIEPAAKVASAAAKGGIKAITKEVTSGAPLVTKSQVGAVGKDVPKSTLAAQVLSHYRNTPNPSPAEQTALNHVVSNPEGIMKTYNDRVTKEFGTSNVVSGDEAKFAIPGFDATKSGAYHEPASALAKVKYDQLLKDPANQQKPVLITSGGSGAGKTSALREQLGDKLKNYAAVVDTNSNKLESAGGKIQQALDTGHPVQVFHVHRDAVDSFENGVIPRAAKIGRIVPADTHVSTHLGSRAVVDELAKQYADHPNVDFQGINNSFGKGHSIATPLDQLPPVGYTKGELANKVGGILNDQYSKGNISPEELHTYLGSSPGPEQAALQGDERSVAQEPQPASPQGTSSSKVVPNRFTEHVQNSPEVSAEVQSAVSGVHSPRSTQGLIDTADQAIATKGLDQATQDVHDSLARPDGQISDQDVASGIKTAIANDGAGNHDAATSIYDSLADHLVAAGRRVQAASILASRTPEGQKFQAIKGLKTAGVELTDGMKQELDGIVKKMKAAPEGSQERSEAMQDMGKFLAKNTPAGKGDKLFTLWRTGLLTGPQTVTKVIASHGILNIAEKAKDIPAVALDKIISKISGQRSTALTLKGVGSGAKVGFKAGTHLLRTGYDTENTGGLTDTAAGMLAHQNVDYGKGGLGKVLNFYTQKTGQVHAALPKAFYTSARANDLAKQAVAAAKTQGVARNEMNDFISSYLANPPKEVLEEANIAAKQATFQQNNALTKQAGQLRNVKGAKWLAPFAHIASAILSDSADYSPIGAGKAVYQAVKDGGAQGWTPQVQKHFVEELGRSITGTSVLVMGAALYKAGVMTTGYPSNDPKQAALWKAEGKQENSILIDGKWRQTGSLGPLGTVLAAGGYFQSAKGQGKGNGLAAAASGMLNNITGQSYLSGLTDAASAINNPTESAGTEAKSLASSLVPTGLATIARATDPNARTATGPIQAIESKIPGVREGLPIAEDPFGETMKREGGVLTNLLDPTRPTTASTSPVIQELSRLAGTGNTVVPSPSSEKTLKIGGVTTKLTPQQQNADLALSGPQILSTFKNIMDSKSYQNLSDSNKSTALNNAMKDIQAVSHVQILSSINPGAAEKAATGLTTNQKGMLNGQPSATNYTALDSNGKKLATSTNLKAKYQADLSAFDQAKAAGTISAEDAFTKQKSLNKEAVTSNYSNEVNQLFAMSKANLDAFLAANPTKTPLLSQVKQLDNALTGAGVQAKAKFPGISLSSGHVTTTRVSHGSSKIAKVKVAKIVLPKVKATKTVKVTIRKPGKIKFASAPRGRITTHKTKIVV